jgi:hypothetical protein
MRTGCSQLTVSNEASKVPANNAVPGGTLSRVELEGVISDDAGRGKAGKERTSFLMYWAMSWVKELLETALK